MSVPDRSTTSGRSPGDDLDDLQDEDLPPIARLEAARSFLAKLESSRQFVKGLASEIAAEHRQDVDTLATMYWEYEDLFKSSELGKWEEIKETVTSRSPYTWPCSHCGTDFPVTSRTHLIGLQNPQRRSSMVSGRCKDCTASRLAEMSAQWAADRATYRARVRELKTMPYAEYLKSPEWQERRKARLRAARYRCQVCNHNDRVLNVHHRTYERRGEEWARDLIVLCQPCHHLFHRNGSLASHPG